MKKKLAYILLITMIGITVLAPMTTFAAAPPFKPTLTETTPTNNARKDNCRPFTNKGFLDTQGIAFDIYTKADGYAFNKGTDGNSGFQLVHFKIDGNKITKKESVKYAEKNVGHANDATMFRSKENKYILVAVSGGKEFTSTTTDGKKTKIAVIWLDEYNKKKATVRGCTLKTTVDLYRSIDDMKISGITYTGMRKVSGKERPVFVLKDQLQMYAAYFTINDKREITLTIFDSARFKKPTITGNYEAAAQGITYHNKFIYFPFSGEKQKATYNSMMVGRITYDKLFKGAWGPELPLQVYRKTTTSGKVDVSGKIVSKTFAKNIPEAIFFKNLNGTGRMYTSFNRALVDGKAKDVDVVLATKETY